MTGLIADKMLPSTDKWRTQQAERRSRRPPPLPLLGNSICADFLYSFEKQAGPNGQGPPNGQAGSNGPGKPDGQGPPGAGGPGSAPANGGPRPGGSDKPTQGGPNGQGTPNQPSKQGGPGQGAVGGGSKPDLRELYGYDSPAVEQGAGSGGAAIGSGIPLIVRRGVVDWLYEYEW